MTNRTNLNTWLVMSVLLMWMAPAIAAGGTIYVDADASTGGDGASWGTAYKYLQDALYKPPSGGDQIWVAAGTYYPDEDEAANVTPNDRTATFQLISGVAIYGGFAGGETSLDERDWQTNETILSGDLNGDDVGFTNNGENSYHVVTGSGTESNAILDGFTITAGNADDSSVYPDYCGGGMINDGGSPTLTNCTFSGNLAADFMGAGGGIYNAHGSPTLTKCTFIGNSTTHGGGMYNNNGNPNLTHCSFKRNLVTSAGGGMANASGSPTLTNCIFSDNSVEGQYGRGAGMASWSWMPPSNPTLTNCIFSGNTANIGGGMMITDGEANLTNCTFSGNVADESGGGLYNAVGNPTLTNCIFWGNTAPTGPQIYNGWTLTVTYSDVEGGWAGTGNLNADPLFADVNLRLSAGSPCIDAGDNTAVPGGVTTDLDGLPRFRDDPLTIDTGNGTPPIVDMGAYEFGPFCGDPDHPYPPGDVNQDCEVNFFDIAVVANHWLECTKPECD